MDFIFRSIQVNKHIFMYTLACNIQSKSTDRPSPKQHRRTSKIHFYPKDTTASTNVVRTYPIYIDQKTAHNRCYCLFWLFVDFIPFFDFHQFLFFSKLSYLVELTFGSGTSIDITKLCVRLVYFAKSIDVLCHL